MKILVLIAFMLPVTVTAQSKADYQHVMAKFQQFYNAGQADSIQAMFAPVDVKPLWNDKSIAADLNKFGTLNSFTFLGIDKTDPQNVYVFQTNFSKAGARTTSLTLHRDLRPGTFRFMTTSGGIDALLKKRKEGR